MNWDYISDGLDPRGSGYAATRRAARSARNTELAMDDMLELAAAPDERTRLLLAQQIRERRQRQAARRSWLRRIDLVVSALIVIALIWFFATPSSNTLSSAVTNDTPASVSKGADDANAPASPARAPDVQGSDDPAAIVARGEQVIHASDAAAAATYADVSRLLAGNADDISVTAFGNALDAAKVDFDKGDMSPARWQQLVALCVASSLRVEMYRGTLSSNGLPSRSTVANSAVGCDKTVSSTLGVDAF